ncbi:GNAT family N-acetyltransferase [Bacillus sp. BGMRC 2118]|nr:GNAT family N-acetyltransferase [Bacillus sp. BGMRC 2118]
MSKNSNITYPSLQTKRLELHTLTLKHAHEVYLHFSNPDVTRFMDIEHCKHIEEAKEMINYHLNDSGCRYGMFTKESTEMIGTLGFHYIRTEHDFIVAEVGFDLAPKYWGNGYMTEAMDELLQLGFLKLQFDRIDATVEPENDRSIKLMENLGFNREIELRDQLLYYFMDRKDFGI